jgi:hypothetical protein
LTTSLFSVRRFLRSSCSWDAPEPGEAYNRIKSGLVQAIRVDWVATNLDREISSGGRGGSVKSVWPYEYGQDPETDRWLDAVFRL